MNATPRTPVFVTPFSLEIDVAESDGIIGFLEQFSGLLRGMKGKGRVRIVIEVEEETP